MLNEWKWGPILLSITLVYEGSSYLILLAIGSTCSWQSMIIATTGQTDRWTSAIL